MNPSAPTAEPGDTESAAASTQAATASRLVAGDEDRILGGVAGFLAGRLGVDVLWVRIGFVLLALAGGIGLVLYAGLWLVLTADHSTSWRWPRIFGGAIVVVVIPLLLNAQAGRFVTGPVAVVLLLTGLALALWRPPADIRWVGASDTAIDDRPPSSLAPPVPSSASAVAVGPETDRRSWSRPRLPRRESSVLGRATLGLAIAVAAIGALIDEANGGRLHPEQWLGAAAVVCGLGLLVGTLRGHGRWLIVPGVLFAGIGYASGISARLGIEASDTFGERWVSIGQQQPGGLRIAHSGFGSVDVYVDARPDEQVVVDARVGIGDVAVRVNDQVSVEVRSRVDDGTVELNGARVDEDVPVHVGPEGPPDVIVEAWVGRGDVNIETYDLDARAAPPFPELVADPALPQLDAPVSQVSEGVAATADGWIILAEGSAVIGPDDVVVVGDPLSRDGVIVIPTPYGEFQLLPRSLLITPFGEVLDLQAMRAQLAATAPAKTPATTVATAPAEPSLTLAPQVPTTTPDLPTTPTTPTTIGG